MSTLISGHFTSRSEAEHAVIELVKAGFAPDAISLLATEDRPRELAVEPPHYGHRIAALGAGLGGAFGALAGGVAAASPLGGGPELPILAAGPLLVAISGFAAGALVGGLSGAFAGHGLPRDTATFVEDEIPGDALVAGVFVHDDRTTLARSVLDTCGAEAITGK